MNMDYKKIKMLSYKDTKEMSDTVKPAAPKPAPKPDTIINNLCGNKLHHDEKHKL